MARRPVSLVAVLLPLVVLACGDSEAGPVPEGVQRVEGYVESEEFERLVIEVDAVEGHGPREASTSWVREKLEEVVDKPEGVEVVWDDILVPRGAEKVWSLSDLDVLAGDNRNPPSDPGTIRMHVLFVDGSFRVGSGVQTVLGIAWGHRQIVIFADALRRICELERAPTRVMRHLCRYTEQSVLLHEVGHLLGLVNNGAPLTADHHDADHGAHCSNVDCVMYWMHAGGKLADIVEARMEGEEHAAFGFGPDCKSDLAALRNGERRARRAMSRRPHYFSLQVASLQTRGPSLHQPERHSESGKHSLPPSSRGLQVPSSQCRPTSQANELLYPASAQLSPSPPVFWQVPSVPSEGLAPAQ